MRGVSSCMTLIRSSAGSTPANIAGMMAKYLATSLAIENVVSEPRVISSCLPISTISMSFVGLESRSTMFPASLAAWVPVFIATPTSAWASAGASFVPSPVMATRLPPSCSRRMSAILSSGVASARKSSTPASCGDRRRGERVVARDHHGADAHRPQLVEALGHARLDGVLQADDAEHARRLAVALVGDDERGRAVVGDTVDEWAELERHDAARVGDHAPDALGGALAHRPRRRAAGGREVHAAHAGLGGEGHEHRVRSSARRARSGPWPARRSSDPPASRRPCSTPARPRRARPR